MNCVFVVFVKEEEERVQIPIEVVGRKIGGGRMTMTEEGGRSVLSCVKQVQGTVGESGIVKQVIPSSTGCIKVSTNASVKVQVRFSVPN